MSLHPLFTNTKKGYAHKTNRELRLALSIFLLLKQNVLLSILKPITLILLKINVPWIKDLIKVSVFKHFCGGTHLEEVKRTSKEMQTYSVYTVLDYAIEGIQNENSYDYVLDYLIGLIKQVQHIDSISFIVVKPSALGRESLYEKVSHSSDLNHEQQQEWSKIKNRIDAVCRASYNAKVPLLVDAEESWMQNAVDFIIEEKMELYNREEVIIYNTAQMYRHDRLDYLKRLYLKGVQKGFKIGIKVVRGAYLEKENLRAKTLNYESPICKSKNETDINFNHALEFLLTHNDIISTFIGTHNHKSNLKAIEIIDGLENIDLSKIWFSQLYGMCDYITYNISDRFQTAKYVPFGVIKDAIPYLVRRASENAAVSSQSNIEIKLLKKELKRRKGITTRKILKNVRQPTQ